MKTILHPVFWISVLFSLTAPSQQISIHIQGSDTLILLGQKLNQLYQRKQPDVTVRVHGGGVQAAAPLLLRGEIDIAQSAGDSDTEGLKEATAIPVGVEGIVIYVNAANPLNDLTIAQVRAIYLGEVLNWKQLGGPDQRILLYGGESSSGIAPYFQEFVLRGAEAFGYVGKSSTKEMLDLISEHPYSIGFAGVGAAPSVKALRIRATPGSPAVEPTIARIRSLQYPISRHVNWYLSHKPQGAVRAFCEWMFSSQGQLVVESVGLQPLAQEERVAALRKLGVANNQTASAE